MTSCEINYKDFYFKGLCVDKELMFDFLDLNYNPQPIKFIYRCEEGSNAYWGRCDYKYLINNLTGVYCLENKNIQLCKNEYEVQQ